MPRHVHNLSVYGMGLWGLGVNLRRWATRDLRSGDLTALRGFARGDSNPHEDHCERLLRRGFLRESANSTYKLTVAGRLALIIRAISLR